MSKTPKLRFPGFTDDWEQRKLGDLYKKNLERNKDQFKADKTISIASMRFKPEGNGASESSLSTYKVLREGDIAFEGHKSKQFSFGRFVVNDIGNGIMSPRFTTLRPSQQIPIKFWKQYINYEPIMKYPIVNSTKLGTMMNELVMNDFLKQTILVPSIAEQEIIGSFFKQLDNLITLHQRKLSDVKKLKAGMLQKMFPKNGETIPEVRFPEFTNAWEQRKLGEVVGITMGQSPNSENYTDKPSDYILVQGNADMKEGHVVPRVWTTQVTKKAKKGDLILSVRAPVGDIGKTGYNVVLGRGVAAIKGNEFIFQQLGKMKLIGYWDRYSTGSTFESINSTDIKDAQINVSSNDEQQKIGSFFQQLDNLITLHQRKLEHLQQQKKALLQQMFI
ncbi:restriction endonuclease subunit S [Leuconostoc gasicomitatum]|uniref:restriction endonuclease subunit S n=1 Tax=Leuconostoc gasicomitatum TaxID=115778 RepID=UPI001CC50B7C|nr:restriction endonuclease subunit S [Leuconostoc gasicomitatum]MBZ5998488.1 restriction endonuclease subunit S [Leuconostoc gasicomitatum]